MDPNSLGTLGDEMGQIALPSALAAIMVISALQGLKKASWFPWLTRSTPVLNRFISIVAAGLTSFGVAHTFSFEHQTGEFQLVLAGSLAGVWDGILHWSGQWAGQHFLYKVHTQSELLGEIREFLRNPAGEARLKHTDTLIPPPPRLNEDAPAVKDNA